MNEENEYRNIGFRIHRSQGAILHLEYRFDELMLDPGTCFLVLLWWFPLLSPSWTSISLVDSGEPLIRLREWSSRVLRAPRIGKRQLYCPCRSTSWLSRKRQGVVVCQRWLASISFLFHNRVDWEITIGVPSTHCIVQIAETRSTWTTRADIVYWQQNSNSNTCWYRCNVLVVINVVTYSSNTLFGTYLIQKKKKK